MDEYEGELRRIGERLWDAPGFTCERAGCSIVPQSSAVT
jgi:hypothetical protein